MIDHTIYGLLCTHIVHEDMCNTLANREAWAQLLSFSAAGACRAAEEGCGGWEALRKRTCIIFGEQYMIHYIG